MIVQIINDQYQTKVDQRYNEQDLIFENLCEIVKSPTISDTKNNCQCIVPFEMNYSDEIIELIQSNANNYTMLIFDSDSGYTIDQFKDQFKEYQYVLFTTFSHTDTYHRFKAFFPLKQPLILNNLRSKWFKDWFMRKYPFQDEGVLKFFKCYLPNCKSMDTYRYHINEGRLYDFEDFRDEIIKSKNKWDKIDKLKEAKRARLNDKFANKPNKVSVRTNQKVLEYLNSPISPTGYGTIAFRAIAVCLTAGDVETLERVRDKMILDNWTHSEIDRMIQNAGR